MSKSRSTAPKSSRKPRGGKAKEIAAEMQAKRAKATEPVACLTVKRLAIVDDEGRIRATLGTDAAQRPFMRFLDETGETVLHLFSLKDDSGLTAFSRSGYSATLAAAHDGSASLFLSNDDSRKTLEAIVDDAQPRTEFEDIDWVQLADDDI